MEIESPDYIYINGVPGSDVGLYVDTPPVPPMPIQRGNSYKNGGLTDTYILEDSYDDITLKIKCFVFFSDNFDNSNINEYLSNPKTLQLSRLNKYYYKVRKITSVSVSQSFDGKKIKYEITFLCEPFKYFIDNPLIEVKSGDILTNRGNLICQPTYYIVGERTTEIIFAVNGTEFGIELSKANEEIIVDCGQMIAYQVIDGTPIMRTTKGLFPFMAAGQNKIVVTGPNRITSMKIKLNERRL